MEGGDCLAKALGGEKRDGAGRSRRGSQRQRNENPARSDKREDRPPGPDYLEVYYRQQWAGDPQGIGFGVRSDTVGTTTAFGIVVACAQITEPFVIPGTPASACSEELRGVVLAHELGHHMGLTGPAALEPFGLLPPNFPARTADGAHSSACESLMQPFTSNGMDISSDEADHAVLRTSF